MTVEQKLKKLIIDTYGSVLEFTNQIGIPNSTLNSIFNRGVNTGTLANILKICDALHISADALARGEIEYTYTPKEQPTNDVNEILANTRRQLLTDRALMFNGKQADDESIQSILDAMEVGIQIAKRKASKK